MEAQRTGAHEQEAKVRVLCVDDSEKLSRAIARLLESQPDLRVVGIAAEVREVGPMVRELSPDVVVLDLTLHGIDTMETLSVLSRTAPEARVLVFSGHSDAERMRRALDSGAWGYVDKASPPALLLDAVRRVARGELAFPQEWLGDFRVE